MRVRFKTFESQFATRQKILQMAADFATQLGPERLINITHSEDRDDEVVTIWYWEEAHDLKPTDTAPALPLEGKALAAATETRTDMGITPLDNSVSRRPVEAGEARKAP